MEGGCKNISLPPASELALLNNLSNLDCTGLKVDNLQEYLTERDVAMMAHFKMEEPSNALKETFQLLLLDFF